MTKLKTRDLVTVTAVREANTRIITRSQTTGRFVEKDGRSSSLKLSSKSIADAGRSAMSKLKK